ncbi:CorA family divalent cation transporter [[Lactobacillus] timonensis]|uniref:CorA family divalent cation transporter n=1 Tax=[Lactobacillus] timonensis TaxID=1970790 RepID=UPI0015E0C85C|nr:CorA family divalent cation transporter [[Lactobacillus] timonensis]
MFYKPFRYNYYHKEDFQKAGEVARFHLLESKQLSDPHLLVVFDFNFDYQHIEEQLTPAILIFDQDHLIICTQNSAVSFEELQQAVAEHDPVNQLVFHLVDAWQQHLNSALQNFEDEIDRLDQASRDTTIKNTELRALTELMRQLVYFEHTVNDQTTTLKALVDSPVAHSISNSLKLKIETSQRRLSKAIHIYRDAVESLSSLYTAMMDNHLNHLMKFLDSTGLVIGIAALLSGLMGMNVGGLPLGRFQVRFLDHYWPGGVTFHHCVTLPPAPVIRRLVYKIRHQPLHDGWCPFY